MKHYAKKKFGQNFLRDKNLLQKIVKASDIADKIVIEVGPGQGALTTFLACSARQVIAYEIDETLKPFLDELKKEHNNVQILYEDFMKTDMQIYQEPIHVVANVPYYITTPILFKILETTQVKTASLMIQKEVCDRLLAKPNHKEYNALSVILQYHAEVKKIMDVKRQMFFPIPNVDSAVIRIVKRDKPLLESNQEKIFIDIVKAAFRQKRKTLVNNWHQAFSVSKKDLESFLIMHHHLPNVRAESLDNADFIKLAGAWSYD
ncbi:MAG: 16S rRNA (adenine(1518)-N(6)/adenine(1519)-N(6))-dimethyltransferase RsmA [Acholeplasmataceae bacterium]|nr:16S rRNA (adenine(1518)-N(6)/adenine(1519)-N(6))-dimethyltransferase RsmA [Acholeplasmataceae bacterium]